MGYLCQGHQGSQHQGRLKGYAEPAAGGNKNTCHSRAISRDLPDARRSLAIEKLKKSLYETVRVTGMVFFIIVGGIIFGKFMALSGITTMIFEFFVSLSVPPVFVLVLVLIGYMILGCLMPANAMLVLTLPIVYPLLVDGFGYDPTLLGILCIVEVEIAAITPPVGMGLFTVKAVAGDVKIQDIIRGMWPFLIMDVALLALFVAFPAIVLWLPQKMF
jgi:C4-dicarboxylate transporter DctM subunit